MTDDDRGDAKDLQAITKEWRATFDRSDKLGTAYVSSDIANSLDTKRMLLLIAEYLLAKGKRLND